MARKRYTTEQIIGLLREAEVRLSQGQTIGTICRSFGVSEQSYYRWRREYGGLKLDQAKRLKDLDRENDRLKRAVSELTLDKLILKEARGFRIASMRCTSTSSMASSMPLSLRKCRTSGARPTNSCLREIERHQDDARDQSARHHQAEGHSGARRQDVIR